MQRLQVLMGAKPTPVKTAIQPILLEVNAPPKEAIPQAWNFITGHEKK